MNQEAPASISREQFTLRFFRSGDSRYYRAIKAKTRAEVSFHTLVFNGGDDGNRTRVRKSIHITFSGRSLSLKFPHHRQTDTPVIKKACITALRMQTLPQAVHRCRRLAPARGPSGQTGCTSGSHKITLVVR